MTSSKAVYGGQAVVEGVMFGGQHHAVTAIRKQDGELAFYTAPRQKTKWLWLRKLPFIRGIVALIEASANGSKHLQFSSDYYANPTNDEALKPAQSRLQLWLGIAVVGILSFLFGKVIFTLFPVFLAELVRPIIPNKMGQILAEGGFKLLLLLGYLYFISLTPLIRRVFQYHGAEHKVINCYEANLPLTVEHVQQQSRLHYRCGSSFILFTVVVGVFVYLFVPTDPLWLRLVNRLLLIPVVLGISFEVLQVTNSWRNIPLLKYAGYPGLALQLLTTKEPSNDQVEVAIASFNRLLELEGEQNRSNGPSY